MKLKSIKTIIIAIILLIGCVFIFSYSNYQNKNYNTGENLTDEEKENNIKECISEGRYEDAEILSDNYYATDGNFEKHSYYESNIIRCKKYNVNSFEEGERLSKEENAKNKVEYEKKTKISNELNSLKKEVDSKIQNIQSTNDEKNIVIECINKYMNFYINNAENLKKEQKIEIETELINLKKKINPLLRIDYDYYHIKHLNVLIGMDEGEVLAFTKYSNPDDVNKTKTANGVYKQYCYGADTYLYFDNGILTTIQE